MDKEERKRWESYFKYKYGSDAFERFEEIAKREKDHAEDIKVLRAVRDSKNTEKVGT